MWLNPLLTCIHFLSLQPRHCFHSTTSPAHHQCCKTSVHNGVHSDSGTFNIANQTNLKHPSSVSSYPSGHTRPYPLNFLIDGFFCIINQNLLAFSALALLSLYMILHTMFSYYPYSLYWPTNLGWILLSDTKLTDRKQLGFTWIVKRTLSVKMTKSLLFIKLKSMSILSLEKRLVKNNNLRLGNRKEQKMRASKQGTLSRYSTYSRHPD